MIDGRIKRRRKNPDVYREANKRYYYKNRQKILENKKKYNAENADHRHVREHLYRKPYLKVYLDNGGEMVCSVCGSVKKLHIHHIDGNHNNNEYSNLICLCDSCHIKTHNASRRRDDRGRYTAEMA